MELKKKIKSYGFWISLTTAVIVVLKTLGQIFSFTVDEETILGVVTSIVGVFVVLGFVNKPTKNENVENKDITLDKQDKIKDNK